MPVRLRPLLVLLAGLGVLLTAAPVASAFRVEGQKWPGGAITYFDASKEGPAVKAAIKAWNSSGARVRFRAVGRSRARVLIVNSKFGGCSGFAQLGYSPHVRQARVDLGRCKVGTIGPGIAAHELGHILGLGHEDRRCATMNSTLWTGCKAPPNFKYRCQTLIPDDVRGAVRLYGGTVKKRTKNPFCPRYSGPTTPTGLTLAQPPPTPQGCAIDLNTASVTAAPARQLVSIFFYEPPPVESEIFRYAGACPAGEPTGTPVSKDLVQPGENKVPAGRPSELPAGRYCFALRLVDALGRRSGVATATIDVVRHPPQAAFEPDASATANSPAHFDNLSTPGDTPIRSYAWDFGDPGSGAENTSTDPSPFHTYAQPGTYTVTLTVTDESGLTSTTTRDIVVGPDQYAEQP
ncbi:MAG: PKD domain-containing protein [Solirubrobacteraceae bacterium]